MHRSCRGGGERTSAVASDGITGGIHSRGSGILSRPVDTRPTTSRHGATRSPPTPLQTAPRRLDLAHQLVVWSVRRGGRGCRAGRSQARPDTCRLIFDLVGVASTRPEPCRRVRLARPAWWSRRCPTAGRCSRVSVSASMAADHVEVLVGLCPPLSRMHRHPGVASDRCRPPGLSGQGQPTARSGRDESAARVSTIHTAADASVVRVGGVFIQDG